MNKTGIEWCDMTWNPVTGCLHSCEYCYACKIANRFSTQTAKPDGGVHDLKKRSTTIYPFGFDPTFHRYRLDEPQRMKKPQTIFACSMADLFGDWVPDSWIQQVFEACKAAPQHRYLFLTKNPKRYFRIPTIESKNLWFGTSITEGNTFFPSSSTVNTFLSIEPILDEIGWIDLTNVKWVIVGAETGNRNGKVVPKKEWIKDIARQCYNSCVPLFMKNSLREMMGNEFLQEFPVWE